MSTDDQLYIQIQQEQFVIPNLSAGQVVAPFGTTSSLDVIRDSNGSLIFYEDSQYNTTLKQAFRFPVPNGRILSLRFDVSRQATVVDETSITVATKMDQIKYVQDQFRFAEPYEGWTFWDSLPTAIRERADTEDYLERLRFNLSERYARSLCSDAVSVHKVGWFLVHWMLNLGTEVAARHMSAVNTGNAAVDNDVLPFVALLNHAINLLDLCIGVHGEPLMMGGMFQPFIRGFVDNPVNWVLRRGTADDQETMYLQLPDDPEDAMANMLRAHPNAFLVRLSPTKAMHLDCIMYRVKNAVEGSRTGRVSDFVVMFSLNMLNYTKFDKPSCPAPLVLVIYMMTHMYRVTDIPNTNLTAPAFYPMSFLPWLNLMIRNYPWSEDIETNDVTGPVMANMASAQAYYATLCNQPARSSMEQFPDYQRIVTVLAAQEPLFQILAVRMLNYQDVPSVTALYREYLDTTRFCAALYPVMDNFGDPGCSVSPTWMLEHVPDTPPNALMSRLYTFVEDTFYHNSLWECERTVAGRIKEAVGFEAPETELRKQHIWHLIRWLGIQFFITREQRPDDPWVRAVTAMLQRMLRVSFAYPFISPDMAENMLTQLGPAARKHGFVLRLSTSTPLAFEQRSHNAAYDPQQPYQSAYSYLLIKSETWLHWMSGVSEEYVERVWKMASASLKNWKDFFRDVGVKLDNVTGRGKDLIRMKLIEYLLRRGLYRLKDMVLVRSPRTIEQYLASCNVTAALRSALPRSTIRDAFLNLSNEEELTPVDVIVDKAFPNDRREWDKLKTLTLSVNARGEGQQLGLVADVCRPGTYARLNFEKLHRPKCDDNPRWLFDQPLLSDKYLATLAQQQSQDEDRRMVKALETTLTWLRATPAFAEHYWCASGRRGLRNLSVMVNWLSYDTVKFIDMHARKLGAFKPQSPADWDHWLALQCLTELSADPVFHLLLTPPEADVVACTYPGFAVVSLSPTSPHSLLLSYVDPEIIFEIQHATLDMDDLRPMYRPDELSLALQIRLMVYQLLKAHLAPAAQFTGDMDRAGCAKADQSRPTAASVTYQYEFKSSVTNQYASQLLAMLLSVSTDLDPAAVPGWYSGDTQRWRTIHPWLATVHTGVTAVSKFFGFAKALPGRAWQGLKNTVYNYNQWWFNPTNYLYGTDTVEGKDFTDEIKPLMAGFLEQETRYAQENFEPTRIPTLLKKLGDTDRGLIRDAARYRESEFRGEAFRSEKEEKTFQQQFKDTVFGKVKQRVDKWLDQGPSSPATAQALATVSEGYQQSLAASAPTAPDTIYQDLRLMHAVSPPAAAHALQLKLQSGAPLGPGETKVGIKLGMLDAQGRVLQAGLAPGFTPRVMSLAGPMSDFQVSGPPFQNIKMKDWQEFQQMGTGEDQQKFLARLVPFEADEGCAENGPDYVFPAFDVDSEGRILPRCGRPGWMSVAPALTQNQYNRLDPTNQKLLKALQNMAKHWCPTPAHEMRLWRWLGISCLGRETIEVLADEALERLDDSTSAIAPPTAQLAGQSAVELRRMVEQFRERASQTQSTRRQDRKDVCKKRVLFLQQMISSNILFPYIPDSKNARVLANYNPERVVIMLGWGKSGSVVTMRDGRQFLEHTYQAEDLVDYLQYVPTTVRLRIFKDFQGGIAAGNYDFYTRVLHSTGQQQCLKSLADMKRYAVRAALPLADQRRLDEVFLQAQAAGSVSPPQKQQLEELQNISLLLQAKNLTTTELYVYEDIRKLENLPANDKQGPELAELLYRSQDVDTRLTEAEQFEALALCQRPEFVPYLRKKLKEKYPELTMSQIEAMDREHLCRVLINNPAVEQMKFPVLLWQIKNVPADYRNPDADGGGLLDLWTTNPTKAKAIDLWLMKNYGLSLTQLKEYNQNVYEPLMLQQQAQLYRKEAQAQQTQEHRKVETLIQFREFLTNGAKCPYLITSDGQSLNLCESTAYLTTKGLEQKLQGDDGKDKGVLDLFSMIYANFCHPEVPLLMNDFEFILQSFNTLKNYFMLRQYGLVPSERRLDKQCRTIQHMYNRLMDDARSSNVSWSGFALSDLLHDQAIQKWYVPLRKSVDARVPMRQAWTEFAQTAHDPAEQITFTFTILVLVAELNGLVKWNKAK